MADTTQETAGTGEGKKEGEEVKQHSKIENYKSYKGFYDLREFDLPKRIFRSLWIIQDALYEMNMNKEYYKKWHSGQWQKALLLSADYQQVLFGYKRKK